MRADGPRAVAEGALAFPPGKAGNPETATGSHDCSSETDLQSSGDFRFSLLGTGNCGGMILENVFC